MEYLHYIIIAISLMVIALAITNSKRRDFKIKINKLVSNLGGRKNIVSYESNKSRFIVVLNDIKLVNKTAIQKMGAKGMVEIDNQLKIILGDEATQLKKYIDELK